MIVANMVAFAKKAHHPLLRAHKEWALAFGPFNAGSKADHKAGSHPDTEYAFGVLLEA